mmetsp:Transcript_7056/g.10992  ORF Transcript_7056/g.10992 Transcript_7056/m.10992 type:complete len:158 (+) Transcript_7056:1592-2065(+)
MRPNFHSFEQPSTGSPSNLLHDMRPFEPHNPIAPNNVTKTAHQNKLASSGFQEKVMTTYLSSPSKTHAASALLSYTLYGGGDCGCYCCCFHGGRRSIPLLKGTSRCQWNCPQAEGLLPNTSSKNGSLDVSGEIIGLDRFLRENYRVLARTGNAGRFI